MTRRELRMIGSGKVVGAVEFYDDRLTFEGLAEPILGYLRNAVGDDQKFGADLMANGWMNMAVELAPPDTSRSTIPDADDEAAWDEIARAAGRDATLGHDELHHWWVFGEGRARWKTWTELRDQLLEHVSPEKAATFASAWFHERYGYWSGSDLNRVKHGKPPRGNKVGPG